MDYQMRKFDYQIEYNSFDETKIKARKIVPGFYFYDILLMSRAPGLHQITHTMADRKYSTPS